MGCAMCCMYAQVGLYRPRRVRRQQQQGPVRRTQHTTAVPVVGSYRTKYPKAAAARQRRRIIRVGIPSIDSTGRYSVVGDRHISPRQSSTHGLEWPPDTVAVFNKKKSLQPSSTHCRAVTKGNVAFGMWGHTCDLDPAPGHTASEPPQARPSRPPARDIGE